MNQKRKEIKKEFTVVNQQSNQETQVTQSSQRPAIPISFDAWWIQIQNKYKFNPDLKTAVRKHFEARGFTNSSEFLAGLKDFGFRI